jgi:hypothetical protein
MNTPGLRNGNRRGTKMLAEKPAQVPLADPEAISEPADVAPVVEGTVLDEGKRPVDRIEGSPPDADVGRRFRPTTQARAITGLACRRRRGVENYILPLGRRRRTYRPAIDAGRLDRSEKTAVEAAIAGTYGLITGILIDIHERDYGGSPLSRLAVFGHHRFKATALGACAVAALLTVLEERNSAFAPISTYADD